MNKCLELPWGIEDTILNMKMLKEIVSEQAKMKNYEGKGETDAKEIEFDFDRAISTLEKQLTNEWIPVTERIPEKSGYYLIQQDCAGIIGYMRVARYNANDCKFRNSEARCYYESVIAWMPLPEPWRGE